MKKLGTSILLLLFVQQLSAFTFYDQLCNFNFNWKKYELRAPVGEARHFNSDKEYIQAHLTCVLAILQSNPVDQLNAKQYNSRLHLIEVLDAYRLAGNFPMNYHRLERIPVFIDENQTHCAVGYLLQQTGCEEMALRISAKNNYAWLKDIDDPEFFEWQIASGFSLEELKLIQGAYDSYRFDAFYAPDKYVTPQKPACLLVYFEDGMTRKPLPAKTENIWCKGEGTDGVLNGKWVQNYGVGIPWIVGYFENGQRSGQWQEYYQGTKKLCRTENWRNNKLNGLRRRFDRAGKIIEEILFKDGNAITKTNYSLDDSLVYVRRPLDSVLVATEIYNFEGALIASGNEKIYNPGNLLWFQNIELTALNSASIQARDMPNAIQVYGDGYGGYSSYSGNGGGGIYLSPYSYQNINLYNTPPLVQYKKEGNWIYYKEYNYSANKSLVNDYRHFGKDLLNSMSAFDDFNANDSYDSIRVGYSDNLFRNFYGYGNGNSVHYEIRYFGVDIHANETNPNIHPYQFLDQPQPYQRARTIRPGQLRN
jgi:hypothetical protein